MSTSRKSPKDFLLHPSLLGAKSIVIHDPPGELLALTECRRKSLEEEEYLLDLRASGTVNANKNHYEVDKCFRNECREIVRSTVETLFTNGEEVTLSKIQQLLLARSASTNK